MHKYIELFRKNLTFRGINLGMKKLKKVKKKNGTQRHGGTEELFNMLIIFAHWHINMLPN